MNQENQATNFSVYQEGMMAYGRSKHSRNFLILQVIVVLLTFASVVIMLSLDLRMVVNDETVKVNWLKIISVLSFLISLVLPLCFGFIYYGSLKKRADLVAQSLKVIQIVLKVSLILLIIAAVGLFIATIFILIIAFGLGLLYGVVFGAILWFGFKYLKALTEFVDQCHYAVKASESVPSVTRPRPLALKNYIITIIVVTALGLIINLFTNSASQAVEFKFYSDNARQMYAASTTLVVIGAWVRLAIISYGLYIINDLEVVFFKIHKNRRLKMENQGQADNLE